VDDGREDATAEVAGAMDNGRGRIRVIRLPHNRGKGYAVRTGMLAAVGTVRLFTDADGSTPIAELHKLNRAIESGAALAIASRALPDVSRTVLFRRYRKIIGSIFNLFVRSLAVPGIRDTQCGFKLFRGEVADDLFRRQRLEDFGFDVELLFLACKSGYLITEVPVNWSDVAGSKVNVFSDSARMFLDILRIRYNWLIGRYARQLP
jgi:dolichyl-phosphate beta-glucosyltransferase